MPGIPIEVLIGLVPLIITIFYRSCYSIKILFGNVACRNSVRCPDNISFV